MSVAIPFSLGIDYSPSFDASLNSGLIVSWRLIDILSLHSEVRFRVGRGDIPRITLTNIGLDLSILANLKLFGEFGWSLSYTLVDGERQYHLDPGWAIGALLRFGFLNISFSFYPNLTGGFSTLYTTLFLRF